MFPIRDRRPANVFYQELKTLSENVQEATREQEILNMKSRLHDQMNMGVSAIRQMLRQNITSEENASAIVQFRRAIQGLQEENSYPQDYTKDNIKYHIRNILQKTGYANKTQLAIAVTGKRYIIPKLFEEQDGSEENSIVL